MPRLLFRRSFAAVKKRRRSFLVERTSVRSGGMNSAPRISAHIATGPGQDRRREWESLVGVPRALVMTSMDRHWAVFQKYPQFPSGLAAAAEQQASPDL